MPAHIDEYAPSARLPACLTSRRLMPVGHPVPDKEEYHRRYEVACE